MRISDWSSDVCPSDLHVDEAGDGLAAVLRVGQHRTLRGVSFTRHGSFLFRAGPGPPFLSGGGSIPALRIPLALPALGVVLVAALTAVGPAACVARRPDDRRVGTECVTQLTQRSLAFPTKQTK